MQIRDYIEANGADSVTVIAVNWKEGYYGLSPDRLERMMENIHPAVTIVEGTETIGRDFGGVHSVPAVYIFDGKGRRVFRLGGAPGPNGTVQLRREDITRAIGRSR